jgi:hypothetical protein
MSLTVLTGSDATLVGAENAFQSSALSHGGWHRHLFAWLS